MPFQNVNQLVGQHGDLLQRAADGSLALHDEVVSWRRRDPGTWTRTDPPPPLRRLPLRHLTQLANTAPDRVRVGGADRYADALRQDRPAKAGYWARVKRLMYRGSAKRGVAKAETLIVDGTDAVRVGIGKPALTPAQTAGPAGLVAQINFAGSAAKTYYDVRDMHRARQKAAGYGDAARDLVQRTRALDTAIGRYNKACREAGELLAAYNADLGNRRYFQPDPNDLHGDLQRLGQAMTQERDALREQLAGLEETPDNQPRRDRLQERIELLELMAKAPDSARAALDDAGAALDASIRGVGAGAGALRGQHATYLQGKRGFNLGKGADLGLQVGATAGVGASAWSQGASVATLSTKAVAWVARRPDLATTVVASHGAVVGSAVLSPIVVTYTARAAWRDTRASFRHGAVADSAERLGRQQRRLADEQDNRALRAAAAGHAPAAADAAERARDHRELAQIAGQIKRRQQTWGLRFSATANLVVATGAGLSSYAALAAAGVLTACAAATPVGIALAAVGGLALVGYSLYRWHRDRGMKAQADAAQRTLEQLPQNLNDPNFRYRPGDDADLDALIAQRTGFAADDPNHPATVDTLRGMQRTAMQTLLRCDPDYAARRLVERLQQENDLRQGATAGFLRQLGVPDDELRSVMDAATDAARADAAALLGDRLHLGA